MLQFSLANSKKKKGGRGSGRMGMECSQTGYDSIPKSASIPAPHKHTPPAHLVFLLASWIWGGDEKDQRMMSNHSELAPRGAYRPVLDHNAVVWFRSPGIGVLVRIVMQGFLLVVLVQLLLCNTQVLRHNDPLWRNRGNYRKKGPWKQSWFFSPSLSNVRWEVKTFLISGLYKKMKHK